MSPNLESTLAELQHSLRTTDRRLLALEQRLVHIELQLGVPPRPIPESPAPIAPAPTLTPPPPTQPTPPAAPTPPTIPTANEPSPTPIPPIELPYATPNSRHPLHSRAFAPPIPFRPYVPPAPRKPVDKVSLENTIGKSVASWVGALIVLGGVLFFLKFAWDQGWLRLSPLVRILIGLTAGAAMTAAGEWLHLKRMRPLSAALAGAGLAVLMASLFAGYTLFDPPVLPREFAFLAVVAVGALGIVLALHMRTQTLAVLSLFGMYISPFVLNSHTDQSLAFLTYLFVVTATGVAIAFFKPRWPVVRVTAFSGAWAPLFTWTIFGPSDSHFTLGLAAVAAFFALFLTELAATLIRTPQNDPYGLPRDPLNADDRESAFALLSFLNTALAMSLFALLFHNVHAEGLWVAALGLAGVMGLITFVTPSKKFAAAAALQALALVVLAVPLYFDRVAITAAWAVLGLALAVYARLTDSRPARVWMFIMLLLVAGRTLTFDLFDSFLQPVVFTLGILEVSRWMIVASISALYALLLANISAPRLVPRDDGTFNPVGERPLSIIAAFIATILAVAIGVITSHHSNLFTSEMLLWAAVLTAFAFSLRDARTRESIDLLALYLLAIISAKWAFNEGLIRSIVDPQDRGLIPPFTNLFFINFILLVAILPFNKTARTLHQFTHLLAWWIAALAFIAINVETLRAIDYFAAGLSIRGVGDPWIMKNIALSILWGLIGFGAIVAGFLLKKTPVRWTALTLLGLTAAKVLLVDMANVETVLRVLSFLITGSLLLLVSFIYHRATRTTQSAQSEPAA